MFKLISHTLILLVGASLGVWWGVYHPVAAQNLEQHEESIIAQAKVDLLQKLRDNPSADNIKQNLDAERTKLGQALQN
jgi:hypothetical protein